MEAFDTTGDELRTAIKQLAKCHLYLGEHIGDLLVGDLGNFRSAEFEAMLDYVKSIKKNIRTIQRLIEPQEYEDCEIGKGNEFPSFTPPQSTKTVNSPALD